MRQGWTIVAMVLWACGGRTLDGSSPERVDESPSATAGGNSAGRAAMGGGTSKPPTGRGGAASGGVGGTGSIAGRGGLGGSAGRGSGGGSAGEDVGPMSDGYYDPAEVYLLGTLSEGACYRDALAHPRTPNVAAVGFDCEIYATGIDPATKRFVFRHDEGDQQTLLSFRPDGNGRGVYPETPHANDERMLTKQVCANPRAYFLSPDGAPIIYQCYGSAPCDDVACLYYDQLGNEVTIAAGYYLVHRGMGGSALLRTSDAAQAWAIQDTLGSIRAVSLDFTPAEVRAHDGGFWVLRAMDRLSINFDGSVSIDGTYPAPPPWSRYAGECRFEGSGALVCFGDSTDVVFEDHIIRAELGAPEAEVIYNENSEPLVKRHISDLVTGP
jgi:hypothetical protein